MLSYYWGVGTGRHYIIIAMPDDIELMQANYITRLGDGLLISYRMIGAGLDGPVRCSQRQECRSVSEGSSSNTWP